METEQIEFSKEKSQQVADAINGMKFFLQQIDFQYAQSCVKRMNADCNMYHSVAPFIRSYDPEKGELIRLQASALQDIIDLRAKLIKCDELKARVEQNKEKLDEVEKMFGF